MSDCGSRRATRSSIESCEIAVILEVRSLEYFGRRTGWLIAAMLGMISFDEERVVSLVCFGGRMGWRHAVFGGDEDDLLSKVVAGWGS